MKEREKEAEEIRAQFEAQRLHFEALKVRAGGLGGDSAAVLIARCVAGANEEAQDRPSGAHGQGGERDSAVVASHMRPGCVCGRGAQVSEYAEKNQQLQEELERSMAEVEALRKQVRLLRSSIALPQRLMESFAQISVLAVGGQAAEEQKLSLRTTVDRQEEAIARLTREVKASQAQTDACGSAADATPQELEQRNSQQQSALELAQGREAALARSLQEMQVASSHSVQQTSQKVRTRATARRRAGAARLTSTPRAGGHAAKGAAGPAAAAAEG